MRRIVFILFLSLLISCSSNSKSPTVPVIYDCNNPSIHVALGIPKDSDSSDDYLIIRKQYVVSYNMNKNVPNWVAWELNSEWFGDVSRYSGNFITDESLPGEFYKVKHSDYTNSGYDRGHMVMSEERTATEEDNKATFILSNVLPQTPELNRRRWLRFEEFCNNLCLNENKELFIYAGGVFHTSETIGNGVAVPDSCWKIVVVLEKGQCVKDITSNTLVYAVMMPNSDDTTNAWEPYKTTIRKIEVSTGYNFLDRIDKKIQDIIENK